MPTAFTVSPSLHPLRRFPRPAITTQSHQLRTVPRIRACALPPTHQPEDLWNLPDLSPLHHYASTHELETDISGNDPPIPPRSEDRDDDTPGGRDSILRQFGRDDHPDLSTLSNTQLTAYLTASQNPLTKYFCKVWPGFRRRVAADPDFPFKVLMELTVGLGLAASGMIAARGERILAELDFAFCDIAVGGTLNFILVYLLTPSIGTVAKAGALGSSLPASVFAPGSYSVGKRVAAFLYKGGLFAGCGFAGSLVGTSVSQGLLFVRRVAAKMSGRETEKRDLPNVAVNSLAWAGFMFVSSNPRYQTVAGLERVLFGFAPESVAKVGSGMLRTANNVLGGANWVWWARFIGLQKVEDSGKKGKEEETEEEVGAEKKVE